MPIYDYQCEACGHRFEVIHGLNEGGPAQCAACEGGPVRKLFAPPSIVFKGSGWAKKDRGASSSTSKPAKAKDEGGTAASSSGSSSDAGSGAAPSAPSSSTPSAPAGD